MSELRRNVQRKESWDKVTGNAKYCDDFSVSGMLTARILTSPHGHAIIKRIDTSSAWSIPGVKAVITGKDFPVLCGVLLRDRPALAIDRVRYCGEPVALVVALDEETALKARDLIQVEYEPLPVILDPADALKEGAPILHPQVGVLFPDVKDIYPIHGTNIASHYQIRRGEIQAGWKACEYQVEEDYYLPPSDHLAMEVRTARAQISADGKVKITTTSQAPFSVKKQIAEYFKIPAGQIEVHVPLVGGGFGGKASVMLEILAYIASRKVGGRPVRLVITREEDLQSAPCRLSLRSKIKLGADCQGKIQAAEITYWLDCGAYSDIAPNMAKSMASNGTGPYYIPNLFCNSFCVYTNHTYATSYRSFGHESFTYCLERAMDRLADRSGIDPLEFRLINAIRPGDLTPTQVQCTPSNTGNLVACLQKVKDLAKWQGTAPIKIEPNKVRVQGVSCLWKSASPPTNAVSGAMITFNPDGSLNLNTGVVEMGSGNKTNLAQILAAKMKLDISQIHVVYDVDTRLNPEHWKTVASLSGYMAGNAVCQAADDVLEQIRTIAAQAFECQKQELEIADGMVFIKNNPNCYLLFKDIVAGYKAPDGRSIGEPVLGRGGFMLKGLSILDQETGKGKPGPSWTVGVQIVELEFDKRDFTYRLIEAYTVIDCGALINPQAISEMIAGGMAMGIGLASREYLSYDFQGVLQSPTLRTYKLLHIGQEPDYRVGLVQTPQEDAPYGIRSLSEHGIIGIPAALGNALSRAAKVNCTQLPLTPEYLWSISQKGQA